MTPSRIALEAHGIRYSYGATTVLHDVSAWMLFGEVTVIAGSNGAGKSTLIEVLAGVRRATHGTVERRGDVSLVVQRPAAPTELPVTVADVVRMGTWKRRTRSPRSAVVDALERVDLADLASRPLAELSGGQRQRAFLAQGIVRRPDILLLDEPAAGLDRASVLRTARVLAAEAARGAAVVCVSHDDEAISTADRVVRLSGGVAQG